MSTNHYNDQEDFHYICCDENNMMMMKTMGTRNKGIGWKWRRQQVVHLVTPPTATAPSDLSGQTFLRVMAVM